MPTFLTALLKYIPLIGGIFADKVLGNSDSTRAAELKAEKELIEAKAFVKGKISPKYLMKYSLVVVFIVFSFATIAALFFTDYFPAINTKPIKELFHMAAEITGQW